VVEASAEQGAALVARIASLRADLDRVADAWDRLAGGASTDEQRQRVDYLRSRIGASQWFEKQIVPYRNALKEVTASLTGAAVGPVELGAAWNEIANIGRGLASVHEEALLYVEGAAAIAAGMDDGICRMSDELLDEISHATGVVWTGTCIPAIREETSQRTWIISIRYPDYRLWWLPIAVHELGHAATGTLRDRTGKYPIPDLLAGDWVPNGQKRPPFLSEPAAVELFADLFATFALGPAYPAAMLWRAVPTEAWGARGADHPGWALRMQLCLTTLRERQVDGAAQIGRQWEAVLAASGIDTERAAIAGPLEQFRERLADELDAVAPGGGFKTMSDAVRLAEILNEQRTERADERLVDRRTIVNAAWITRIAAGRPWDIDAGRDAAAERSAIHWLTRVRTDPAAGPL
jgi:hypothetical protein